MKDQQNILFIQMQNVKRVSAAVSVLASADRGRRFNFRLSVKFPGPDHAPIHH